MSTESTATNPISVPVLMQLRLRTVAQRVVLIVIALLLVAFAVGVVVALQIGSQRPDLFISPQWTESTLRMASAEIGVSPRWVVGYHIIFESILAIPSGLIAWWIARSLPCTWFKLYLAVVLVFIGAAGGTVFTGFLQTFPALTSLHGFVLPVAWMAFFSLLHLFPDGRFIPSWSRWLTSVWLGLIFCFSVFKVSEGMTLLLGFLILGLIAVGVIGQAQRFHHGDLALRQQLKWTTLALAMRLVLMVCIIATPIGPIINAPDARGLVGDLLWTPISYTVSVAFVIAIGVAMLRHSLFDIDLILNRTLVYGGLTAFVIGVYASVVGALGTLIQAHGSFLASLIAAGVVAVLFQPLRERLQRGIDRLLYGQRGEPYAVIAQLGEQLAATHAPDDVLHAITQTIGHTLKLPYVKLETCDERQWQAEYHEPSFKLDRMTAERLVVFPLTYQGEQLGVLQIAPRAGERLSRADHTLLDNLARQAGIAVHAARATADLQRSRERIVTAREEERRRIRRDLHDGLGPQLASQTLKLETAHDLIPAQPVHAQAVLNDLVALSQKMMGEIRQLVYALRPPALDDFGLIGALRDVIARVVPPTIQVEMRVPDAMPPLPAAVEVAVYRIAQEAITNVARHAQATHCVVQMALVAGGAHPETLILEVCDNGIGVAADARSGVGMYSMRERVEELGGTLSITSNQPHGMIVQVALPIVVT